MPKAATGSGGLTVPRPMRELADSANPPTKFLSGTEAQRLRDMYDQYSTPFNPELLSPFGLAVFTGDFDEVMKLGIPTDIKSDTPFEWGWASLAVLGAQRIRSGPTPLRHREILTHLLSTSQQGVRVDPDFPDIAGYTALHHASMNAPMASLIEELLDHGANPNIQDKFGCTPLLCALCSRGQDACIRLLAGGADPSIADGDGTRFDRFPPILITEVTRKAKIMKEQKQKIKAQKKPSSSQQPKLLPAPTAVNNNGQESSSSNSDNTISGEEEDEDMKRAVKPEGESIVITEVPQCPKECIVKIQVPLAGSEDGDLLIYDQHRTFTVIYSKNRESEVHSKIVQTINERCSGSKKGYFKAERVGKDGMRIYLDPMEVPGW